MNIVIVVGPRAFLEPEHIRSDDLAPLVGENVLSAMATWISSRCGVYTHRFLLDADVRPRPLLFAESIHDNFGGRIHPLLILPDLLEDPAIDTQAAASIDAIAMMADKLSGWSWSLVAFGAADGGGGVNADLECAAVGAQLMALADRLAARGATIGTARVVPILPNLPGTYPLVRNALAGPVLAHIEDALSRHGFAASHAVLAKAIAKRLSGLAKAGSPPVPNPPDATIRLVADAVLRDVTGDLGSHFMAGAA
jgi:hypothetical protein